MREMAAATARLVGFARHSIVRCNAAFTEQARSSMRAIAAATARRMTALLVTHPFDSVLL